MSGTCFECKFMRQRTDLEPCEHCTNVFAMTGTHPNFEPRKPITNADRIRTMTDEELADWLTISVIPRVCEIPLKAGNEPMLDKWLDWLKQEAGE